MQKQKPPQTLLRKVIFPAAKEEFYQPLVPEMDMLGWSRFPKTEVHGLCPHAHTSYEFCYIVDGAVSWWVGEERFDIGRGEVFFTRPDEQHGGTDDMMHPCELYWVQVLIPENGNFLAWTPAAVASFRRQLADGNLRRFPGTPDIVQSFAALMAEHESSANEFSAPAVSALLSRLLIQILRARNKVQTDVAPLSPLMQFAVDWMTERLGQPFDVQDAAAVTGLHPSRFHDRFLAEIGLPPSEWRMRQRIKAAQHQLLTTNASVTDIAFQSGFTTSQHFATAFKKYTGHTPTDYRLQASR